MTNPDLTQKFNAFISNVRTDYDILSDKINYCKESEASYYNELTVIVNRWREILAYREFSEKEISILIPNIAERLIVRRNPKDPTSPGLWDTEILNKYTNEILMWLTKRTIIKNFMPKQNS